MFSVFEMVFIGCLLVSVTISIEMAIVLTKLKNKYQHQILHSTNIIQYINKFKNVNISVIIFIVVI